MGAGDGGRVGEAAEVALATRGLGEARATAASGDGPGDGLRLAPDGESLRRLSAKGSNQRRLRSALARFALNAGREMAEKETVDARAGPASRPELELMPDGDLLGGLAPCFGSHLSERVRFGGGDAQASLERQAKTGWLDWGRQAVGTGGSEEDVSKRSAGAKQNWGSASPLEDGRR